MHLLHMVMHFGITPIVVRPRPSFAIFTAGGCCCSAAAAKNTPSLHGSNNKVFDGANLPMKAGENKARSKYPSILHYLVSMRASSDGRLA